jgi:hypothetical protein
MGVCFNNGSRGTIGPLKTTRNYPMRDLINTSLARQCLSLVVLVWLALPVLPANAAVEEDAAALIGARPNAGGPPVEITVRLLLLDIDSVDDKEQRFSIDAYVEIEWQDSRLATNTGSDGFRSFAHNEIWNPGLTIINDRGLSVTLPRVAEVDSGGKVVLRQRLAGQLAVDLKLHEFPFDTQDLAMIIVSYRYPPSELLFSENTELISNVETYSANGWGFEALEPAFSKFQVAAGGRGASQLTFTVRAKRDSGYYVLTLALPMALILFMAWMVHWIQPTVIPPRIGMSTATVFSLIALGVSFRLSLPKITYLTHADRFVVYSTLLVLLSLGVTVVATRLVGMDRVDAAHRVTTYARWSFPFIFALIMVMTFGA